jgi:O-glycosyl hydrolase
MTGRSLGALILAVAVFIQAQAIGITFDGATSYQTIEGIGVNVNYRSWGETNLPAVLDAYRDEAGTSLLRLTFDLSDWEATNDDSDSSNFNWAVYNPIYSSPEFNRLWDMLEHLNHLGYTNRVVLTFMGWGPAWMMDSDGRSLKPGMEDEWAEMIASALIYARNTRGVQLNLVTPNNEPDIYDEGIRITSGAQYADTLHRLAEKLDAAGITDLWFVGPCRSNGATNFLAELTADATVMARLKHFGVHAYNKDQGNAAAAYGWITNSPYADRTLWMTEFNAWCSTCDTSDTGFFNQWDNARDTAQHLFYHLQGNASAALAWEGFDSIYAHHYTNWGYFGLVGVDNINAPIKTYTPRKSFYTVAQLSKWVCPGAQRIDVSEPNTWPLTYLAAFKHDALEQVVVSGVNVSSSPYQLEGILANLPVVTNLALYYTSANTNLAPGGNVPVSANGSFAATIPADCVFTLVGSKAERLVQNTVSTRIGLAPGNLAHYYFDLTNPVARVQFDVMNPTADVSLFVDSDHPSDGHTLVPFASRQPFASPEQVVLREGVGVKDLRAGRWFASVRNDSTSPVAFSLRAFQINESGFPLLLGAAVVGGLVCLEWNAVPGGTYVVEGSTNSAAGPWLDLSGTLVTFGGNGSYCLPTSASQFFRIKEGVSAKGY